MKKTHLRHPRIFKSLCGQSYNELSFVVPEQVSCGHCLKRMRNAVLSGDV